MADPTDPEIVKYYNHEDDAIEQKNEELLDE